MHLRCTRKLARHACTEATARSRACQPLPLTHAAASLLCWLAAATEMAPIVTGKPSPVLMEEISRWGRQPAPRCILLLAAALPDFRCCGPAQLLLSAFMLLPDARTGTALLAGLGHVF